jgi:hypothetical protein
MGGQKEKGGRSSTNNGTTPGGSFLDKILPTSGANSSSDPKDKWERMNDE